MNPKISIHLTTQTEQDDPTIPSVMVDKWSALKLRQNIYLQTAVYPCLNVLALLSTTINSELCLTARQLKELTVEEPEAEFSLTIMITNEDSTIQSSSSINKMAVFPVSTVIVTSLIYQIFVFLQWTSLREALLISTSKYMQS